MTTTRPLCPSAQPDMQDSMVLGVVEGTVEEPRLTPLREPVPVTPELLELAGTVEPTEVFRFAAPCASTGCQHFESGECQLAKRMVAMTPGVVSRLPPCRIRPHCRWWRQEGRAACQRCPGVVTTSVMPTDTLREAATPRPVIPLRPVEHAGHVEGED